MAIVYFFFGLFDIFIQVLGVIAFVRILFLSLLVVRISNVLFFKFHPFCHFFSFSCSSTNSEWQTLFLFVSTRFFLLQQLKTFTYATFDALIIIDFSSYRITFSCTHSINIIWRCSNFYLW